MVCEGYIIKIEYFIRFMLYLFSFLSHLNFNSVPSGVQNKYTILAGTNSLTPDEVEVFYLGDQVKIKSTNIFIYLMNTLSVSFSLFFISHFFVSCVPHKVLFCGRYIAIVSRPLIVSSFVWQSVKAK